MQFKMRECQEYHANALMINLVSQRKLWSVIKNRGSLEAENSAEREIIGRTLTNRNLTSTHVASRLVVEIERKYVMEIKYAISVISYFYVFSLRPTVSVYVIFWCFLYMLFSVCFRHEEQWDTSDKARTFDRELWNYQSCHRSELRHVTRIWQLNFSN